MPSWRKTDAIGEDVAAGRDRQLLDQFKQGIRFEASDDAAGGGIELCPPRIIVIAQIEDIGGARFDRHLLCDGDVVDIGGADGGIDRRIGVGVVDQFLAARLASGGHGGGPFGWLLLSMVVSAARPMTGPFSVRPCRRPWGAGAKLFGDNR